MCVCVCWFSSSPKTGSEIHAYQLRLSVGIHNLKANEHSVQRPKVKRIVRHPAYSYIGFSKSYDFALLELRKPLKYNDKISPICVDDSVFPEGTECTVTGWGITESKNDTIISQLDIWSTYLACCDRCVAGKISNAAYLLYEFNYGNCLLCVITVKIEGN